MDFSSSFFFSNPIHTCFDNCTEKKVRQFLIILFLAFFFKDEKEKPYENFNIAKNKTVLTNK